MHSLAEKEDEQTSVALVARKHPGLGPSTPMPTPTPTPTTRPHPRRMPGWGPGEGWINTEDRPWLAPCRAS